MTAPVRWGPWWYYERTFEGRATRSTAVAPRSATRTPDRPRRDPASRSCSTRTCSPRATTSARSASSRSSPDHRLARRRRRLRGRRAPHGVASSRSTARAAPPESIDDVGYSSRGRADAASLLYVRVDDGVAALRAVAPRPVDRRRRRTARLPRGRRAVPGLGLAEPRRRGARRPRRLGAHDRGARRRRDARRRRSRSLWPRRHGVECSIEHLTAPDGSRWWLAVTNDGGATDFKVARRAATRRRSAFREVLAEQPGRRVDGVDAFAGHLVVSERRDGERRGPACSRCSTGADPFGDDLEARGFVVASDEEPATTVARREPRVRHRVGARRRRPRSSPRSARFDVDARRRCEARCASARSSAAATTRRGSSSARLWVTARDGVEIPVSIVHRRDLLDRARPGRPARRRRCRSLLYGYGAYEISIDPVFSSSRLSLLERGVAFAIAHVRGGGELGRSLVRGGPPRAQGDDLPRLRRRRARARRRAASPTPRASPPWAAPRAGCSWARR